MSWSAERVAWHCGEVGTTLDRDAPGLKLRPWPCISSSSASAAKSSRISKNGSPSGSTAMAAGEPAEHFHTTRMVPKRVDELLDGGSLYWVIKGRCRPPAADRNRDVHRRRRHRPLPSDARSRSVRNRLAAAPRLPGLALSEATDAPRDLGKGKAAMVEMPPKLRRELAELGLL